MTRHLHISLAILLLASPALAEQKQGMPQMDTTWMASQLFWLYVCFIALYVVVSRSLAPKVARVLETRASTIKSNLAAAEQMSQDAQNARSEFERVIAESRRESETMITKVQADASATMAAEQAKLDERLKHQLQQADGVIAKKLADAELAVPAAASALAVEITSKLLGRTCDAASVDKHIAKA